MQNGGVYWRMIPPKTFLKQPEQKSEKSLIFVLKKLSSNLFHWHQTISAGRKKGADK